MRPSEAVAIMANKAIIEMVCASMPNRRAIGGFVKDCMDKDPNLAEAVKNLKSEDIENDIPTNN